MSCSKKLFSGDFNYEKSQIISKFHHFSRFFRDNSVENSRIDIWKNGRDTAWWVLHLYRQKLSSKINIWIVIIEKLKKILKIADFASLGPKYLGPQTFPDKRFVAVNSKYSLISHIFELGIFNDGDKPQSKLPLSRRVPASAYHFPFSKGNLCWRENVLEHTDVE